MTNTELTFSKKVTQTLENIKYNSHGYWIMERPSSFISSLLNKKTSKKVSIVSPVYNSEKYLRKSIDSVINQTIEFKDIEYILIDDCSTDNSRKIILEYAHKYPNIIAVFLEENSGSPSYPRNLGIELSTAEYITFLDSDDWLDTKGTQALLSIADETKDDYIVGKTVKVENDKESVIGEHQSARERRSVDPYTIPNVFQHLGPPSKLIKTKILKDHHIKFPNMKFAEDKQFFMDVLINTNTASTTSQVVCYVNRLTENDSSLTQQTNVFEKVDTNIKVIKYIKEKKIDIEKEKKILNRLYEFDSITRLFDRQHFLRSKDKQAYYNKFNEVLETTKDLNYDFSNNFFWPINKVTYDLFIEKKYDQMIKLLKWNKTEKDKQYIIKNNLPYMIAPFLEDKYKHIEIPMLAIFEQDEFTDSHYSLEFKIYGAHITEVNEIIFRDRNNVSIDHAFDLQQNKNSFSLKAPLTLLSDLEVSTYSIFVRYNEYRRINIMKINHNQITFEKKNYNFYTTVNSNVALKIKNSKY